MGLSANEHQMLYQQHRVRVQNAKSIVNSQAPLRKSREEGGGLKKLSFVDLMATLSGGIQRGGYMRTFTKTPDVILQQQQQQQRLRLPLNVSNGQQPKPTTMQPRRFNSAQETSTIGGATPTSTPVITPELYSPKSSTDHDDDDYEYKRRGNRDMDVPKHVLQRYEHMTVPRNLNLLRKLLRPKIYFDMEVKQQRPLGRIVIQLFTEACPEVVLEFVRACSGQEKNRINFTRLFAPLWFEGELALDDGKTLTKPNLEHDFGVLDHGSGSGILSFPSRYVRGSKRRFLSFTISFKPLKVLNGKRIAFGRVRRGNWILDTVQDYGTKNGKPLKEIIVTHCGVLK